MLGLRHQNNQGYRPSANLYSRFRNCCFTINNPTEDEINYLEGLDDETERDDENIKYVVWQTEKGVNDTEHIQGYVEFKKQIRGTVIKDKLGGRAHIEKRRGSAQQASDYCKKQDSRIEGSRGEFGQIAAPGTRKDSMKFVVKAIAEDKTVEEIAEEFPVQMLLHKNKIIDAVIEAHGPRKLSPNRNNIHIFYGPSGSGKTTTAWNTEGSLYKGVWPTGGRWWWPNYKGEETIIFDEFRENLNYQQMIGLFDLHPMSIEYKGGNTQNISKHIIITTIRDPVTWYSGVEDKSELQRRIKENSTIYDFNGTGNYPNFNKVARDMDNFQFNAYEQTNFVRRNNNSNSSYDDYQ